MKIVSVARVALTATVLAVLGGCASMPTGPSVLVLPGTNRDINSFRADEMSCRQFAAQMIGGPSNDPSVRNAVVGTAVGAVAGAAIGGHQGAGVGAGAGLVVGSAVGAESARSYTYDSQRQYDNAYIQCMYSKGHRVPVSASLAKTLRQAGEPTSGASYPPPPDPARPPSTTPPPDYVAPR
jgi:uncharacterized protein YcfJ